jgi:RNA polymerase sigma-70 factor (ECF subfamily)
MFRNSHSEVLPNLFRLEFAKMTAVLCRHFGLKHIELAEDIASDAFLKAAEYWPVHGIPDNPARWLYTVAINKARDYLKHTAIFDHQVRDAIKPDEAVPEPDFEFSLQTIADSQLSMIFAVCNPAIPQSAQICLALQILCGFSVEEIAGAFLAKTETIKKRLQRARAQLRNDAFKIGVLSQTEVAARLNTVLKTLYLLFNEGYFSKTHDRLIRKELCSEAVRLALVLTQNPLTDTPPVNALLALVCFQSSRLDARTDIEGKTILFEHQDRTLWDQSLIDKGNFYLVNAFTGEEATTYHLEAAIAYWHTTPEDDRKWINILSLYDQLLLLENSPVTALNRTFAFAKVHGCEKAIAEACQLNLEGKGEYHQLLGFLYTGVQRDKAIEHYKKAIALTKSRWEKQNLERLLGEVA